MVPTQISWQVLRLERSWSISCKVRVNYYNHLREDTGARLTASVSGRVSAKEEKKPGELKESGTNPASSAWSIRMEPAARIIRWTTEHNTAELMWNPM